jgi:hypothetical protein
MTDTQLAPLPIEVVPVETIDSSYGTYKHLQWVYRFANDYGASVIQGDHSYGGPAGKYELAVLDFAESADGALTYETPITDDVLGWLSLDDVAATLIKIAALHRDTATVTNRQTEG